MRTSDTDNKNELLNLAISAVFAAGKDILEVYHTNIDVLHKDDDSPVTLADKRAHYTIIGHLKPVGIPVLSEEGRGIPYDERKNWQQLWLVDPLDGTEDFIKRNDEFTVNIALVINRRPYLGVVYAPVKDQLYFGWSEAGSFKINHAHRLFDNFAGISSKTGTVIQNLIKNAIKLPIDTPSRPVFTVVASRSHPSPELGEFIEKMKYEHGKIELISAGSSLKMCMVAEGNAEIYPRLGPTMEWDTAAGQAVAEYAGATVFIYGTKEPLTYNKESLLNPWFIVEKAGNNLILRR